MNAAEIALKNNDAVRAVFHYLSVIKLYLVSKRIEEIFDISVVDMIQIIKYEIGQEITVEYKASGEVNTVLAIQ